MAKGETLRSVCRDDAMPPESTVRQWALDDVDGFAARYARARALLLEHWAEEIVEIADDGTGDFVLDAEGQKRVDSDHIQRSRLRVDTRKWLLSKLHPASYGERQTHELTGKNGGPIEIIDASKLTDEELDAVIKIRERLTPAS